MDSIGEDVIKMEYEVGEYSINEINTNETVTDSPSVVDIVAKIHTGEYKIINKRKGRSDVWNSFGEIEDNFGNILPTIVCCRNCLKTLKYTGGQTTNLLRHKCYKLKKAEIKKPSEDIKQNALDACASLCIKDCRPISAVDGIGFKEMVKCFVEIGAKYGKEIDVEDLIPHSSTVSKQLNQTYDEEKENLKNLIHLKIKDGAAITIGLWTDDFSRRCYLTASIHYIDGLEIEELTLGLKSMDFESNSEKNINDKISTLLREFDIHNLIDIIFVTDGGSNMIKALAGTKRLNCSNHLLNNVIECAVEKTKEMQLLLTSCKKLSKYLKSTNIQQMLSITLKTLKSHNKSRWNSHLSMLNSILLNWDKIGEILQDKKDLLVNIDFKELQHIVKLLQCFNDTLLKLQMSHQPTIHYVYSSINFLQKKCEPTSDDTELVKKLKQNILKGINCEWIPNLDIIHRVGLYLFPPANKLRMFSPIEIFNIKEYCKQQMKKNVNVETDSIQEPPPVTVQHSFDDILFSDLTSSSHQMTVDDKLDAEIERYSNLSIDYQPTFHVIEWWNVHCVEFPNLFTLSKKIFCIPAGSAASERVFSLANEIIIDKRNRLHPNNANNVIFLNSVYKLKQK